MSQELKRLLIANRGEISSRIQRTCRRLGIHTVAVFSEADSALPFVRNADEAICIGAAPATASYLNQERILEAAKKAGADAIHPGYGFLAEDAAFAKSVEDASLIFVGPSSAVVRLAGSKIEAKKLATAVEVPVIPGFPSLEDGVDAGHLTPEQVGALHFPVLIKAAHGGGGRGMRIVRTADELASAVSSAYREACSAFGNGTLLFETYLPSVRHVEVQVLGDRFGNLIHLFERDCSTQRRHQKLIEETPAPALEQALRERLFDAALRVAKALDYENAGTVEFVVDDSQNFYFLEINARLQVEHTVTEMTTGVDLVEEQLRLARGEPLKLAQHEVVQRGYACEARLCAEDAQHDHLPMSGELIRFDLEHHPAVRIDAAVSAGCRVSTHYDSLLAKVIAHGESREESRRLLSNVLERSVIHGVPSNRTWLRDVLRDGTVSEPSASDAGEVGDGRARGAESHALQLLPRAAVAVILHDLHAQREARCFAEVPLGFRIDGRTVGGFRTQASFRVEGPAGEGQLVEVFASESAGRGGRVLVEVGGETFAAEWFDSDGHTSVEVDDRRWPVVLDHRELGTGEREIWVSLGGETYRLIAVPRFAANGGEEPAPGCRAPMAGTVREVSCVVGQQVEQGAPLVVLEAMKMEHVVAAAQAGTVTAVQVSPGDQVEARQSLVDLVYSES